MKKLKVNIYNKTVEDYIKENPNSEFIPFQRKILKLINKHLIFFDNPFPFPTYEYNFNFHLIREKKNEMSINYNFFVYADMVYCQKCDFLLFYNEGDSLLIVFFFLKIF